MEALAPLRVVDFSRILAGPFATMMLADLGADVTKVERPGSGDDTRTWGPPFDDAGRATYFQAVNRNKRSVALDLAEPADRGRAAELVADADVVVENFRPGTMARLGLDYESARATNPGLVYCSITGFGERRRRRAAGLRPAGAGARRADEHHRGGRGRAAEGRGRAGGRARRALRERRHPRRASATATAPARDSSWRSTCSPRCSRRSSTRRAPTRSTGTVPGRMGNAHPSIAPYELFQAADRELVLAVGNDAQFARLCATLGLPELAADERFATNPARVAARVELRGLLEARLATKPAAEWVEELTAAGVPAGVVNDVGAAFALAERLGLEPVVEIAREEGGAARLPRNPIRLSATPPSYRSAPPELPGPG